MANRTLIFGVTLIIVIWFISGIIIFYSIDNWSDRGTFGDMFGAVNSLFTGIALLGIVYSIYTQRKEFNNTIQNQLKAQKLLTRQNELMVKSIEADHERRRKQSTIEYINSLRKIYKPLEIKLRNQYGKENVINYEELTPDTEADVRELLSVIEHLSTGVNTGVYDVQIINRMSGRYFLNLYKKLFPYIDFWRKKDNAPTYFIEFEEMTNRIRQIRIPKNTSGNIKLEL